MHRGHCYLIEQVKAEAARRGLIPIVITFEEHPRLALSQTRYWPELLTTNAQKLQLLAQTGLAACAMLHFDHTMSMLTSREFMELVLKKELNVQCLLIGYDHHFGSDLSAGYKDYVKYGKELGIDVLRERPFDTDELRISSSATRRFLTGGNVEMARACLGRPYQLEGSVVEGPPCRFAHGVSHSQPPSRLCRTTCARTRCLCRTGRNRRFPLQSHGQHRLAADTRQWQRPNHRGSLARL